MKKLINWLSFGTLGKTPGKIKGERITSLPRSEHIERVVQAYRRRTGKHFVRAELKNKRYAV